MVMFSLSHFLSLSLILPPSLPLSLSPSPPPVSHRYAASFIFAASSVSLSTLANHERGAIQKLVPQGAIEAYQTVQPYAMVRVV